MIFQLTIVQLRKKKFLILINIEWLKTCKIMFVFIKQLFIGLLTGLVNESNHTTCVPSNNHKRTTHPTIINLHLHQCTQGLHYYPFVVNLDRYVGSCNTFNNLFGKGSFPNKTKDLNMSVFKVVETKIVTTNFNEENEICKMKILNILLYLLVC